MGRKLKKRKEKRSKEVSEMRMVVISDMHCPFQDDTAIWLVNQFCRWYKPHIVIIDGDLIDFYAISKFDKSPERATPDAFQAEVETARAVLAEIRKANPKARIILVVGNHEFRLRKYLYLKSMQDPLFGKILQLANAAPVNILSRLLKLNELGIELADLNPDIAKFTDNYIKIGNLYIGHWDRANKHAAYTAKNLLVDKGVNGLQAHTHRIGTHIKTTLGGTLEFHEIGCLCSLDPHYTCRQDWAHGFAVVEGDRNFEHFTVHVIHIRDYEFRYGKKTFKV